MEAVLLFFLLGVAIQLSCCSSKNILVKLLPPVPPFLLYIWDSIYSSQRIEPGCGVGGALMVVFVGAPLAGIALGWVIYAFKYMLKEENMK